MELKVTEEFIREAHEAACSEWKSKIEKEFPELFKCELEVGKWYKDPLHGNVIYCSKIANDGTLYGYGFVSGDFKVYEDEDSNLCLYNYVDAKRLIESTPEEVEKASIAEAKKKGYVGEKIVLIQGEFSGTHSVTKMQDDFSFESRQNRLMCKCGYKSYTIFKDGKWAEIFPEEKTVITLDKAKKILAKKYKTTVEQIEIK